mmetsp:Transcript_28534/g.96087  ORF Transcript_28534/g.96087 Transcript_28534/m.96087 type:complete len:256 (-) Transcript_28534:620-1387(-)
MRPSTDSKSTPAGKGIEGRHELCAGGGKAARSAAATTAATAAALVAASTSTFLNASAASAAFFALETAASSADFTAASSNARISIAWARARFAASYPLSLASTRRKASTAPWTSPKFCKRMPQLYLRSAFSGSNATALCNKGLAPGKSPSWNFRIAKAYVASECVGISETTRSSSAVARVDWPAFFRVTPKLYRTVKDSLTINSKAFSYDSSASGKSPACDAASARAECASAKSSLVCSEMSPRDCAASKCSIAS